MSARTRILAEYSIASAASDFRIGFKREPMHERRTVCGRLVAPPVHGVVLIWQGHGRSLVRDHKRSR